MTERDREARRLRLFLARLERDQDSVAEVHERLRRTEERARTSGPDLVNVAGVALYLQNLYTALEELLRRVAVELDGSAPVGDDWHRELLEQMTLEVDGVRPRLLDDRLRADLDLLRRFRHLVRHAYAAEYDWDEMQSPLEAAHRVVKALPEALAELERTVQAAILECERSD